MTLLRPTLLLAATCLAAPAMAGPASDTVRFFYKDVPYIGDSGLRGRFVDPALAVIKKDERLKESGEEIGCIDFAPAIDAQDFDQSSIDSTLKLEESVSGDTATVTARFKAFADAGEPQTIVWTLKRVGGSWKVADIESPDNQWRLGEFGCDQE